MTKSKTACLLAGRLAFRVTGIRSRSVEIQQVALFGQPGSGSAQQIDSCYRSGPWFCPRLCSCWRCRWTDIPPLPLIDLLATVQRHPPSLYAPFGSHIIQGRFSGLSAEADAAPGVANFFAIGQGEIILPSLLILAVVPLFMGF